jgi:type I restriction enzyme S subunit
MSGCPLPPEDEQSEIVRRLDVALDTLRALHMGGRSALSRTEALERSALAKAFRGELAQQDPNDEPAATLVDRIGALDEKNSGDTTVTRRTRQAATSPRERAISADEVEG